VKPPAKRTARKVTIASSPRKIVVQWNDGPLLEIERRRLEPLTDAEFWKACKAYLPADLQTPAAAYLLEKARRADAGNDTPRMAGRPPGGMGLQVHGLITGPFKWDQKTARRLVAGPLCECRDKHGLPAEQCTCGAYERVKAAHNQWKRERRRKE
jgi:hypothetical protein